MKQRKIVGFAGRKGSGKTFMAKVMVEEYGFQRFSFADALKSLACELLSMNLEELDTAKRNNVILNIKPDQRWFEVIGKEIGYDNAERELRNVNIKDVRFLLQYVGTEVIRKYDPLWHVFKTLRNINRLQPPQSSPIVVDDVRYRNELQALEDCGACVFFVIRPGYYEVSNHSSERSLSWRNFGFRNIILNNKDEEHLRELVRLFMDRGFFVSEDEGRVIQNYVMNFDDELCLLINNLYNSSDKDAVLRNFNNPLVLEDIKLFCN